MWIFSFLIPPSNCQRINKVLETFVKLFSSSRPLDKPNFHVLSFEQSCYLCNHDESACSEHYLDVAPHASKGITSCRSALVNSDQTEALRWQRELGNLTCLPKITTKTKHTLEGSKRPRETRTTFTHLQYFK